MEQMEFGLGVAVLLSISGYVDGAAYSSSYSSGYAQPATATGSGFGAANIDYDEIEPNGATLRACAQVPPGLRDAVGCPVELPVDLSTGDVQGYAETDGIFSNHNLKLDTELFEGDIRVLSLNDTNPASRQKSSSNRGGVIAENKKWTNAVMPFVIDSVFSDLDVKFIKEGMCRFYAFSCVRFKPRTDEKDFVKFTVGKGCSSLVGKSGGKQLLKLNRGEGVGSGDSGCLVVGTPEHEMMHALGFIHEQSRLDRNTGINYFPQNVLKNALPNFAQYKPASFDDFGQPYDVSSLMQYGSYSFSIEDGVKPTMTRLDNTTFEEPTVFSDSDKIRLNKIYPCPNVTRPDDSSFDMTCSSLDRGVDFGPDPVRGRRRRR